MRSCRTAFFGIVPLVAVLLLLVAPSAVADTRAARGGAASNERASADRFGIQRDLFAPQDREVRRNQTFADLLLDHGVDYQRIVDLARATRDVFDVRDIKAGQTYRVYVNPWLQRARYLVYRPDPVRYVVFDVRHPDRSHVGRRPVNVRWESVGGTIDGSLYETLIDRGAQPELALHLSEVFAWQIDFFRLQRGDRFRVVYEKRSVDGMRIRPGQIIAAFFEHQDATYHAFRFDEGRGPEYFDEEGNSLRRQLLKAPLRYSRISSRFTYRRFHPVLKRYRPHLGTDYAAPSGTPVHAVGDGTVTYARYKGYNGNYVKIRHNGTYTTGYLHLSRIADGVQPGVDVQQGETIGYVGSTGLSTGPHLDYRLWKHGKAIDPYSVEMPPSRPVQPQYRDAFERLQRRMMNYLHAPPVARNSLSNAQPRTVFNT